MPTRNASIALYIRAIFPAKDAQRWSSAWRVIGAATDRRERLQSFAIEDVVIEYVRGYGNTLILARSEEAMVMAKYRYVITTRDVDASGNWVAEPGQTRFLRVPAAANSYDLDHEIRSKQRWRKLVADAADGEEDEITGMTGDVLLFVHGYANTAEAVLKRSRLLQDTLREAGWRGVVIPFDWPSDEYTLNYLEDRSDAAAVAGRIVQEVIPVLMQAQAERNAHGQPMCTINVHLLGHSTGAFVIMEALAFSQKMGEQFRSDWRLGQVAFIGADVASNAFASDSEWAKPMFSRIHRLTNYSNGADAVLAVSNAKRLGTSPRAGRVGLPKAAHDKAVNVDCTPYFMTKDPEKSDFEGTFCHSWHIGDPVFALDLSLTLGGGIDRNAIPTRTTTPRGLALQAGVRPRYQDLWAMPASPVA